MSLDKSTLISSLTAIFSDVAAGTTPTQKANSIADAIDTYVKSGTISFTSGQVTGTCPPSGGPLTSGAGTGGQIS